LEASDSDEDLGLSCHAVLSGEQTAEECLAPMDASDMTSPRRESRQCVNADAVRRSSDDAEENEADEAAEGDDVPFDGMAPAVDTVELIDSDAEMLDSLPLTRRALCLREMLVSNGCKELGMTFKELISSLRPRGRPVSFQVGGRLPLSRAKPALLPPKSLVPTVTGDLAVPADARSLRATDLSDAFASKTAPLALLREYSSKDRLVYLRDGYVVFEDDGVQYLGSTVMPLREATMLNLVSLWLVVALRHRYEACVGEVCERYGAKRILASHELLDFLLGMQDTCSLLLGANELDSVPPPLPQKLGIPAGACRRPVPLASLREMPGHRNQRGSHNDGDVVSVCAQVVRQARRRAHAEAALCRAVAEEKALSSLLAEIQVQLDETEKEISNTSVRSHQLHEEFREDLTALRSSKRPRVDGHAAQNDSHGDPLADLVAMVAVDLQ